MSRAGRAVEAVLLVAVEAYVASQYVVRGTAWHLLLHVPLGLGAGLVVAALLRSRHPVRWAVLGEAVSVVPDVLFVTFHVPHERWMDVFVAHVTVHVVPQPLLVAAGAFLLAGWGWWCRRWGGPRLDRPGLALALAAVALVAGALALHRPLPTRLSDYGRGTGALETAWCGPGSAHG